MKIMMLFGTRPEIIRLCRTINILDRHSQLVLVNTSQNYVDCLNGNFVKELEIRDVNYSLGVSSGRFALQLSEIMVGVDRVLDIEQPDRVLVLGDTTSALSSIVAARRSIPIFHMEAGNRCYDTSVPEEINRKIIDNISTILMPYTERSARNLVREGVDVKRIFVTGNPIYEVLCHYEQCISSSDILGKLSISKGCYILATAHRSENVDNKERLLEILTGFAEVSKHFKVPVIVSTHPRLSSKLTCTIAGGDVRFINPFGFFDFVCLERNALAVITDSGTVQEESCILGIPTVTIRTTTERPETIECGSNSLAGLDHDTLPGIVNLCITEDKNWNPPTEYLARNVSARVAKIVLGHI